MELELEDDIAMPVRGTRLPRISYPFSEMKVGQSFFVPMDDLDDEAAPEANAQRVRNRMSKILGAASKYRQNYDETFFVTCARFGEAIGSAPDAIHEGVGVRVWRIEPAEKVESAEAKIAKKPRKAKDADAELETSDI